MAEIGLIDTSLRDGNQSLWGATGLNTAMMLGAAPLIERVGFRGIDYTSSTHMAVAVRFKREDPWERMRLMREMLVDTPMQFLTTGFRFISWETANPEFMQLVYDTLVRNGIRRFAVADPMNDVGAMLANARMIKKAGGEYVVCALTFTLSPVHDDAHYLARAGKLAASADVDALYMKDPGGLLAPDRAGALVPAVKAAIGGTPLEVHSHCTIGLAEHLYLNAPDHGARTLHVATGALGDGASNPPSQRTIANLRERGHTVAIDDAALAELAAYYAALADAEGLAAGAPQGFDAAYRRHQLPGGMVGTTRRHLAEARVGHAWDAVMAELGRVREELGWPIMMTPFSQLVLTQAVMNVTGGGGRYAVISDELIRYALGRFGRPNTPIAAEVIDRIMSLPRTKELRAEPDMAPLRELRRRIGAKFSDEEFLLRAVMPAEQVDAMKEAGPAKRRYEPVVTSALNMLRELTRRCDVNEVCVERPGFRVALRRNGTAKRTGAKA